MWCRRNRLAEIALAATVAAFSCRRQTATFERRNPQSVSSSIPSNPSRQGAMRVQEFERSYRASHWPYFFNALVRLRIRQSGEITYELQSNVADDQTEIGFYRTQLAPNELSEFDSLLSSPPIETLPDQRGRLVSLNIENIRLVTGGVSVERVFDITQPQSPAITALFDRLDRLSNALLQHPVWSVRLEIVSLHRDGATATARVRYTNRGIEPIGVRTSEQRIEDAAAPPALNVHFVESVRDPEHAPTAARIESVMSTDSRASSGATFVLPPAQPIEFSVRVRLPNTNEGTLEFVYRNSEAMVDGSAMAVGILVSNIAVLPGHRRPSHPPRIAP